MSVHNKILAEQLESIGTLLRLAGENEFRAIAFDKAARVVETCDRSVAQAVLDGTYTSISGIGPGIARDLNAFITDGKIPVLEELKARIPAGLLRWLDISGLGPKRIRKIHEELGITELADLKAACADGRVAAMSGMGVKSAEKILKSIEWMEKFADRCTLDEAWEAVIPFRDALAQLGGVQEVEVAGSLRRSRETIGDLDLLVSAEADVAASILDTFATLPEVTEVLARGESKCSVRTTAGRQVDVRVVAPEYFAASLMYFTGSKEHNVALRGRARERGLTLNEYGLFPLDAQGNADLANPMPIETEADAYEALGLGWIPPELREDRGEFEWIRTHQASDLVDLHHIKGILHAHSTWSDGAYSLEAMAQACIDRGYGYLGITDHSKSAGYAGGLSVERVFAQWKEIDALNDGYARAGVDFRILKGIESDILTDGRLDYDDDVLAGFDFVIGSVHNVLDMPVDAMLERFKRAVDHPACRIIGHPTGRLLLRREGNAFDLDALIDHAAAAGVAIEINASTWRLDMDWKYGPHARQVGLMSSINPDAHETDGLDDVRYGVGIARKAGFGPGSILNTKPVDELVAWFKSR